MQGYADLADLSEDTRIQLIGEQAKLGKRVGFVVDNDEKADRYIAKLLVAFPGIEVASRNRGPVYGTILVAVIMSGTA